MFILRIALADPLTIKMSIFPAPETISSIEQCLYKNSCDQKLYLYQ